MIDRPDVDRAIELAANLLVRAAELQTPQERRQQAELDRMINHAEDKATLVEMTDQAFRTHTPARVADQLTHLLDVQGVPRFFSPVEQAMLRANLEPPELQNFEHGMAERSGLLTEAYLGMVDLTDAMAEAGLSTEDEQTFLAEKLAERGERLFRVMELTVGMVRTDPACLVDEAASLSFTGGRRVVWIREATDAVLEHLQP